MKKFFWIDTLVGLFVLAGLACLAFLALQVGNYTLNQQNQTYTVTAAFDNIGGLKNKAPVKLGGFVIGRVTDIHLDNQEYQAVATIDLDKKYKLPSDSSAKILTSGLLGEQYIGITPGSETVFLKNKSKIDMTSSAVVLEELIGQFLYNKAESGTQGATE
jgi:phospholipid/cholesterol/gamma-HCH transport system substrate-binding protein